MTYIDQLAKEIMRVAGDTPDMDSEWFPLFRIYAVLCLAKGTDTTAKDVHDAWTAWASQYRPGHKSSIAFEQLADDVKQLDDPYVAAIHACANEGG